MTDRTPTGDLRERIAEAMRAHYIGDQTTAMGEHLCVCGEWADGTDTDDWDVHLADAVMHVIEAEILAVQVDATQRADELAGRLQEAERQRDEALAAVQRVRELHVRNVPTGDCEHCSERDYPDYAVPWPCPTIAALDQPEGT